MMKAFKFTIKLKNYLKNNTIRNLNDSVHTGKKNNRLSFLLILIINRDAKVLDLVVVYKKSFIKLFFFPSRIFKNTNFFTTFLVNNQLVVIVMSHYQSIHSCVVIIIKKRFILINNEL